MEEVEQCRDDPLSAACNRALLTQYGLRISSNYGILALNT